MRLSGSLRNIKEVQKKRGDKMKRKVLILLILAASLITVASGTVYISLYYPGSATVPENPELTVYLDSVLWANTTTMAWGDVSPGQNYAKNLTVLNTGNTGVTVILRVQGLPSGWSLSWLANQTAINSGEAATGTLSLSVPTEALAGSHTWDQWIEGI